MLKNLLVLDVKLDVLLPTKIIELFLVDTMEIFQDIHIALKKLAIDIKIISHQDKCLIYVNLFIVNKML